MAFASFRRLPAAAVLTLLGLAALSGCRLPEPPKVWEYKVVTVGSEGHERSGATAGKFASVTPSGNDLDALGAEGWELATSYLEMETAWVNFGNDKYVTGLQPNVRPQRVVFVFKRPKPAPKD